MLGGTACVMLGYPTRSEAFLPILGKVLAELALGFSLRIGARTVATSALSATGARVGIRASRAIGKANKGMRTSGFNNFSKAEVSVAASLPVGRMFYPVISRDDKNACVPFVPEDDSVAPVFLEAPSLFYLTESAGGSWMSGLAKPIRQQACIPVANFDADFSAADRSGYQRAVFFTEMGHCVIHTKAMPRSSDPKERIFAGAVSFHDRKGLRVHAFEGPKLSLYVG